MGAVYIDNRISFKKHPASADESLEGAADFEDALLF
jgi:hypothetical protein